MIIKYNDTKKDVENVVKQYKKKNAEWYVYNKELTTDELSEFR